MASHGAALVMAHPNKDGPMAFPSKTLKDMHSWICMIYYIYGDIMHNYVNICKHVFTDMFGYIYIYICIHGCVHCFFLRVFI